MRACVERDAPQRSLEHHDAELIAADERASRRGGERVATLSIFLNDVDEGGATRFADFEVEPRRGDALLWWNCAPDGKLDAHAAHSEQPVLRGVKLLAVQHFRAGRFAPH